MSVLAADGAVPTLKGVLPPQVRSDLESLRRFVRARAAEGHCSDPVSPTDFRRVLLTGATGFVGRFVLRDLLETDGELSVRCLVRCTNPDEGFERVRTALLNAEIWDEAFADRIVILPGDVSATRFGASEADFRDLCECTDAVYHLAADLSLSSSYLATRRVNTFSIRNILELCLSHRRKHLFYASTMGVFPEYFCNFAKEFRTTRIGHQMQPDLTKMKRMFPLGIIGYPWNKLVVEQTILHAMAAGLPAAVFRLPQTSTSSRGFAQPNDIKAKVLSAVVDTGTQPPGKWSQSYPEPVDVLSRICTAISRNPERRHTIYHCCNPRPIHRNLELSEFGLYFRRVSYAGFKSICQARGKRSPIYGHWALIDQFAPYWFAEDDGTARQRISDRAIREDCPHPIEWPGMLTMFRHFDDWIRRHPEKWPHPVAVGRLDIDRLIAQAQKHAERANAPFEHVYPEWMQDRLRHLVSVLSDPETGILESDLNSTVFDLSRLLRNNAALAGKFLEHPEIEREEIVRPVFIVGLNRTGTTFLHRLLSRDQRFWTLRAFELFEPVLREGTDFMAAGTDRDPRRAMLKDLFDASDAVGNMAGIHPVDVDEPEEDFALLRMGFSCWTNAVRYRLPEYGRWLATVDLNQAYGHHLRVMKHFTWQRRRRAPGPPKRWLFKMPFHLQALDSLIETYPDALFIQTHRPPSQVMGSWNSLVERVRSVAVRPCPRDETGAEQLAFMSNMLNGATQFRLAHPELERQWLDVDFDDLVIDPMEVVSGIYDGLGLPEKKETSDIMADWIERQKEERRKVTPHSYRLEDFGLTPETVDAAFAPYLEFLATLK